MGSNPTEGKICFSHFTLLEWNVKNCFVKLIKTLKILYVVVQFARVLVLVQYSTSSTVQNSIVVY